MVDLLFVEFRSGCTDLCYQAFQLSGTGIILRELFKHLEFENLEFGSKFDAGHLMFCPQFHEFRALFLATFHGFSA
jgi:hypothetical protein